MAMENLYLFYEHISLNLLRKIEVTSIIKLMDHKFKSISPLGSRSFYNVK